MKGRLGIGAGGEMIQVLTAQQLRSTRRSVNTAGQLADLQPGTVFIDCALDPFTQWSGIICGCLGY